MTEPLTVAYVGNFRRPWCTEVHVAGSLEAMGHRVIRMQEDAVDWRRLPRRVGEAGAGLLLWTRTWHTDQKPALDALYALRDAGVRSASYHLDRWFGLEREPQVLNEPFFRTDVVVSPDDQPERWEAAGVNHLWMPPGVYAAECGVVEPEPARWPWDVVFVGSVPYPHPEWHPVRQALLDGFAEAFGDRFKVLPDDGRRPVRGRDLQSLYATVPVVLGDSCLAADPVAYWSDRVPETLGRGGLLIHPDAGDRFRQWYGNGVDLLAFPVDEPDVAVELTIEALLGADGSYDGGPLPVEAIRAHGRATVLARDTYAHRMTALLEHLEALHGPLRAAEPVRASRARPLPDRPSRTHTGASAGDGLVRVSHRRTRVRGVFAPVPADGVAPAVGEVWTGDTYRVTPEQVRGGVVVDVGGNVGAFAVLAAKLGARAVQTYEPHPANYAALVGNVERNKVTAVVTTHQAAVVDGPGTVQLAGDGGGASIVPPGGVAVDAVGVVGVLAGLDVALLKVDTEGSEYRIVAAMGEVEFAHVARIVMEFHGPAMPHLGALDADGGHLRRWSAMVARLANYGRLTIEGRPTAGGLLWWERF